MATLLDTSALAVLIRSASPPALERVGRAARDDLEAGRALVSAMTAVELLVGARDEAGARRLSTFLEALPVIAADRDVAMRAGRMGAYARALGATIPVPDLVIAATAIALDIALLTCDSDFRRGIELGSGRGEATGDGEEGGVLWARLRIHPASAFLP